MKDIKISSLLFSLLLVLVIFVTPSIASIGKIEYKIGKIEYKEITKITSDNDPPNPPEISGPTSVIIWRCYTYSFKLTDPNGDRLEKLEIDWGDGTAGLIMGLMENGSIIHVKKRWARTGDYQIKARVTDTHGEWSNWGYLQVSVPIYRSFFSTNIAFPLFKFQIFKALPFAR